MDKEFLGEEAVEKNMKEFKACRSAMKDGVARFPSR